MGASETCSNLEEALHMGISAVEGLIDAKEVGEVAGGIVDKERVLLLINVIFETGGAVREQLLAVL